MLVIGIVILVAYFVLIAWTWQSLEDLEKTKRVIAIVFGIIICYFITLILFNISKSGIDYKNIDNEKLIKRILTMMFTAINGIIFIPNISKIYINIKEDNLKKQKIRIKIIALILVFIVCVFFECRYLKDMQIGIMNVYNKSISQQQNNS